MPELIAYPVKTLSPIIAPTHSKPMLQLLIEEYQLDPHLDRIFYRTEINGRTYILITGRTTRYAFHKRFRELGLPIPKRKLKSYGIVFEEKYVSNDVFVITANNNKQTLMNAEVVLPNAKGLLLLLEDAPEQYKKINQIMVHGLRNMGFGWIQIFWNNSTTIII